MAVLEHNALTEERDQLKKQLKDLGEYSMRMKLVQSVSTIVGTLRQNTKVMLAFSHTYT